jgi:hypothetical protein
VYLDAVTGPVQYSPENPSKVLFEIVTTTTQIRELVAILSDRAQHRENGEVMEDENSRQLTKVEHLGRLIQIAVYERTRGLTASSSMYGTEREALGHTGNINTSLKRSKTKNRFF